MSRRVFEIWCIEMPPGEVRHRAQHHRQHCLWHEREWEAHVRREEKRAERTPQLPERPFEPTPRPVFDGDILVLTDQVQELLTLGRKVSLATVAVEADVRAIGLARGERIPRPTVRANRLRLLSQELYVKIEEVFGVGDISLDVSTPD